MFSRVKNKLILFVSIKKPIDLDLFEGKYVSWVFAGMTFSFNYLTNDVKKCLDISPLVSGWVGDHKNRWDMKGRREVTLIKYHKIVNLGIGNF